MSSIPSNLARVPNGLAAGLMRGALGRTNVDLMTLQMQMSTMQRINRPSDDPIGTSIVGVLEDLLERRDQRLRNLSHADAVLGNTDAALSDLAGILIEAKGIASSQIGIGSDQQTRANQAEVIDAMLSSVVGIANRKYQQINLFAGSATGTTPIQSLGEGLRYLGIGEGMLTDLGQARPLPITISGERAFGSLSARVEGDRDLDPQMIPATRLSDLRGAGGQGIRLGSVAVDVDGTDLTVDLTGAASIGDVAARLESALTDVNPAITVQIDPASGSRLQFTAAGSTITIFDPGADATAADLGISGVFTDADALGADLDPVLTELTPLSSLDGLTIPMGSIRIANNGQSRDLDLSGAETVRDLINLVEGLGIGVRVEINEGRDRFQFLNEVSGAWMSIGEVPGGVTAGELGVRTFSADTRLEDFNDGLGVQIRSGSLDPITGLPDPARDVDFRVVTRDGTAVPVDLAGAETVQDALDRINDAAATAGLAVPADFQARLANEGNGIELVDNTNGGVGTLLVEAQNGSFAALDLGIEGSTTSATLVGEDRAKVAVESLFTQLIRLRDALRGNDERGITLAGERLESDISRVTEARALVGVRSQRVLEAQNREEDQKIQDLELKSQVKDLDFTEAAMRFSLLQQQLQAGLTSAARTVQLSLLDFIR